jgi:hypothetical protein
MWKAKKTATYTQDSVLSPGFRVEPPEQQSADDDQQVLKQPVAAGPGAIAIAVQKLISIAASTA